MDYVYFKDLTRRTDSDKILCNKAFNIAKSPKYDVYQRGLALFVYELFDKKRQVELLKMRIFQTKNLLKDYADEL